MSSKTRKPLGKVDSNRLHQHQSKQPNHHRRRPQSKSTGGSDSNSIASLVDDSDCAFLSNPKPPTNQQVPGGAANEHSNPSLKGAWNSTSKTPKISNVTALSMQQKVDGEQDVTFDVSPSRLPRRARPESTSAPSNKSENESATSSNLKFQVLDGNQSNAEIESQAKGFRSTDFQRNTSVLGNQSRRSESSALTCHRNTDKTYLETIVEGTPEEESDSPASVNKMEAKQVVVPSMQYGIHTIENDALGNTSDMDESSDDEIMGLTLSPPIPVKPASKQNTEIQNCIGAHLLSPPKNSDCQNVPNHESSRQIQQKEFVHTPTQPFNPHLSGIAKKSTPHPVKTTLPVPHSKPPKYSQPARDKLAEGKANAEPSPLPHQLLQNRQAIAKLKNKSGLAAEPRPPRHGSTKRHAANEGVLGISSANSRKIDNPQRSPLQLRKSGTNDINAGLKPFIQQALKERNVKFHPVDKEVWQAVMGIPEEAESTGSLVGLVIETPHTKPQNDLGDSASLDGSELTHDTNFLLENANLRNHVKIDSLVKTEHQSENPLNKFTSAQKPFRKSEKPLKYPIFATQQQLLNVKNESHDDDVIMINNGTSLANKDHHDRNTHNDLIVPDDPLNKNRMDSDFKCINRTPEQGTVTSTTALLTPRSLVKYTPIQSNCRDSKKKEPRTSTTGHRINFSPSAQQIFRLLQDEVHAGVLSHRKMHRLENEAKLTLWTSDIAGRKFKAFGVNAAPVFKLLDGTYYQHPPLPPGWTIAVSRSQNVPFYIHPDFGSTFYSPVPLPSNDGKIAGTTLLYQSDTPRYPQLTNDVPKPPTPSTPFVFGAQASQPEQASQPWSNATSTVVTQRFKIRELDTPVGALVVASSSYFSESQNEAISNAALQQQMIGVTPASASDSLNDRLISDAHNSPDHSSCYSADSSTTVTEYSCQLSKISLPREIQILRVLEDQTDEDRFKRDLDNTGGNGQPHSPAKPLSESKSRALVDSCDKSLDWGADVSPTFGETELIDSQQGTDRFRNEVVSTPFEHVFTSLAGSLKSSATSKLPIAMLENNPSPFDTMVDDEGDDCVPHEVAVPPEMDDDDMSLIQCSPQQSEKVTVLSRSFGIHPEHSRLSLPVGESNLIVGHADDKGSSEDCSYASLAARSYFSSHSNKSRASCRSLNPKLPICSLQYLHVITTDVNKRKKKQKKKPEKRRRTNP